MRGWPEAAVLILLFGVMGIATRLLCADASGYSSFWPANASMVVALLVLRLRYASAVLAACLGLNLVLNGLSHLSPDESVLACILNVGQSVLVALLTRRFCGARTDLTRLSRLATFALVACVATGIEAGVGVAVEVRYMNDDSGILADWLQWVLCDTLGLLLATPTVLLMIRGLRPVRRDAEPGRGKELVESSILSILTVILTIASFLSSRSFLFLLMFPAMVTLAFRVRPAWVLTTLLIASIFVSALTEHGLGPIAFLSPDGTMMRENMLQPYLFSLFLSALPANNALGEKHRFARRLIQMRANLEQAATQDPLTSLMNRQVFKRRLACRARSGAGGTVLFIDLDHFKRVNDTLGHQAGDRVLRCFADRLAACARDLNGAVSRFGGDEFAMLIPDRLAPGETDRVCADILHAARTPYVTGIGTVALSVSIGVAIFGRTDGDPDEVLRRADMALYAAKDAGRDDYRLFGALLAESAAGELS